jgi:hypothetical protein
MPNLIDHSRSRVTSDEIWKINEKESEITEQLRGE